MYLHWGVILRALFFRRNINNLNPGNVNVFCLGFLLHLGSGHAEHFSSSFLIHTQHERGLIYSGRWHISLLVFCSWLPCGCLHFIKLSQPHLKNIDLRIEQPVQLPCTSFCRNWSPHLTIILLENSLFPIIIFQACKWTYRIAMTIAMLELIGLPKVNSPSLDGICSSESINLPNYVNYKEALPSAGSEQVTILLFSEHATMYPHNNFGLPYYKCPQEKMACWSPSRDL